MRWSPGADSSNVEDRRGQRGVGMAPMGIGGTVVLLVLSLIFGHNFFADSGQTADQSPAGSAGGEVAPVEQSPEEAKRVQFVTWVLDTAQATWARLLPAMGATYTPAKLVLFRDATNTACGLGESAMGPFYCPRDERVYIDLGFYDELRSRFGAPGDFAQAYVIAHELGHHVQHLLGLDAQVRRAQQGGAPANALSIALELQADCYAGVWGNAMQRAGALESGDLEEGLNAAAAIGDDRLQRQSTGRVVPETFTHGTSAQRSAWLGRGLSAGNPRACDTFRER
jgi:predicted metalloprotease